MSDRGADHRFIHAWPNTAAWIARVLEHDGFVRIRACEELSCRTPIDRHRDALRAVDAPIMAESYGTSRPRRGILQI